MTIFKAAATASDTLDQTSDTLIDSLTLTPGDISGLCTATFEVAHSSAAQNTDTEFSIYVNGSQIPHTERRHGENSSVDSASFVITMSGNVSPGAGEAVEIRYRRGTATQPPVCTNREMNIFPHPAAGTVYEASATATDTGSTGGAWEDVDDMLLSPAADDYFAIFTSSLEGGANNHQSHFRIEVGGVAVDHTERIIRFEPSANDAALHIAIVAKISPNGSQDVVIQEQETGFNTGPASIFERTLTLIPGDDADISTAEATADDTDSTTTDLQIDDMLIADIGDDDWLTLFNTSVFFGSRGNVGATLSIYNDGSVEPDSERLNTHEESIDLTDLPYACGSRVTVAGATDDLQIFWQGLTTDERTCRQRTVVAMREASAAPAAAIMNQIQGANVGADLYNGTIL